MLMVVKQVHTKVKILFLFYKQIFIVSNNDFLISEPLPIAPGATPYLINQNGLHISCNGGSDGTINLTTSGGTNPYQYFYRWWS